MRKAQQPRKDGHACVAIKTSRNSKGGYHRPSSQVYSRRATNPLGSVGTTRTEKQTNSTSSCTCRKRTKEGCPKSINPRSKFDIFYLPHHFHTIQKHAGPKTARTHQGDRLFARDESPPHTRQRFSVPSCWDCRRLPRVRHMLGIQAA